MPWNVDAAIKHLEDNAESSPAKQCGLYVRLAINAGGLSVVPGGSAGNYGPNLVAEGFRLVESCSADSGDQPWTTVFKKGDVVIYDGDASKGLPHGHAQMHTGKSGFRKVWISDYKQAGFWCYSQTRLALRIYRHGHIQSRPAAMPIPTLPLDLDCGTPRAPTGVPPRRTPTNGPQLLPYPGRLSQYGSRGTAVEAIQIRLTQLGWPLNPDGSFGNLTKSAVVSYQTTNRLSPDGQVGSNTWSSLFG